METLIYYPSFEPPSDTWLKFALIFFEKFKPIVPYNRQHLLSDNFRRVVDNTDLIELYSPGYNEGYLASLRAIEEAERVFLNTYDRSYLFRNINVLRKWQIQESWNYLIFEEKFSQEWINFCLENNLGIRTEDGILVSEELGFLFMTYLAKEIAFADNASIITDNYKFDIFTNYSRSVEPSIIRRANFAKEVINLVLPGNISEITIEQLVRFRRENRELISAFNVELDNIQSKIGEGYTGQDFINNYKSVYKEIYNAVLAQGHGIIIIPLSTYILLDNRIATTPDYINHIIGSLGIIHSGFYSINKGLRDTRTRRYCKKYLTNLEQMN